MRLGPNRRLTLYRVTDSVVGACVENDANLP